MPQDDRRLSFILIAAPPPGEPVLDGQRLPLTPHWKKHNGFIIVIYAGQDNRPGRTRAICIKDANRSSLVHFKLRKRSAGESPPLTASLTKLLIRFSKFTTSICPQRLLVLGGAPFTTHVTGSFEEIQFFQTRTIQISLGFQQSATPSHVYEMLIPCFSSIYFPGGNEPNRRSKFPMEASYAVDLFINAGRRSLRRQSGGDLIAQKIFQICVHSSCQKF